MEGSGLARLLASDHLSTSELKCLGSCRAETLLMPPKTYLKCHACGKSSRPGLRLGCHRPILLASPWIIPEPCWADLLDTTPGHLFGPCLQGSILFFKDKTKSSTQLCLDPSLLQETRSMCPHACPTCPVSVLAARATPLPASLCS